MRCGLSGRASPTRSAGQSVHEDAAGPHDQREMLALALQQAQLPEVRYSRPIQVDVRPVDGGQDKPSFTQTETKETKCKILREKLRDIFE